MRRTPNNVDAQAGLIEQEGVAAAPVVENLDPCNLVERHVERPRTTEGLSATTNEGKRGEATTEGSVGGEEGAKNRGIGGGEESDMTSSSSAGGVNISTSAKPDTSSASSSTTPMPTTTEMAKAPTTTKMLDPETTALNTVDTTSNDPTTKMISLETTTLKSTTPDSTTLESTTLESTTFKSTTLKSTALETTEPTTSLPRTLDPATGSSITPNKTSPQISTHKPTPTTTKSSVSTYFPTEDVKTVADTGSDVEEDSMMALPDIHSFSLPHFSLSTLFPPSLPSLSNEVATTESKLFTEEADREPKSEPEGESEPESEPEANVRSRTDARALSEDLIDFNEIYKHEQSGQQCHWAPGVALLVVLHTAVVILI